ncbi:carboxypeptidase-like regulatory domain-containing protein [Dyadobacter tibetensis]|uniref:carboxypeptidase-like regulatory domain-containing protein n=1 Tax=Dyadobacter tibetensis TaxID=1211851 RepID=UPI000472CE27|nr:carboxypeptidase-like regulatory domain-containing protein [Dyadobacter tibetensis]
MKRFHIITFCLILSALFQSCDSKNPDPHVAEEGFATGKVVDTQGNPMSGVEVVVDNTMIYNSTLVVFTDANGQYKVKLPRVGTFVTSASIKRKLNDKTYTLDLHPEQDEAFSIDGGIRNFQWKLSGPRGSEYQGYYGCSVSINKFILSEIYDVENIEFTLVPIGKLIDGTSGKTLKLKSGKPHTNEYGYLVDIPLGRYQLSAVYKKDGRSVPLRIGKQFDEIEDFKTDFQLDFEPENIWGNNSAIIQYSE